MIFHGVHGDVVDARLLPQLISLDKNLIAAAFFLMKLIPAKFMVDRAVADRRLSPNGKIVETSSGTFGLALAIISALRGFRLTLVGDSSIDEALGARIRDLGTRLEIVDRPASQGGFQQARLDRVVELQHDDPELFWPSQYDSPQNPGAYSLLAEQLIGALGKIDCLIGAVGSGGSMCGTGKYLRLLFPTMDMIAVDTMNSVLFGQPDGSRLLRGLGNSLMPGILDHELFDQVHWVTAAEAFYATRQLHRKYGLYMGGTSGAAFLVARWYAKRNPDKNVVVLFPDEGHRYAMSIYDDNSLRELGAWVEKAPLEPLAAKHPSTTLTQWSKYDWNRRSLGRALGTIP
jgi:cysteine synthase